MQLLSRTGCVVGSAWRSGAADGALPFVAGVASVSWVTVAQATLGGGPLAHAAAVAAVSGCFVAAGILTCCLPRLAIWRRNAPIILTALLVGMSMATGWLPLLSLPFLDSVAESALVASHSQFWLLVKAFGVILGGPSVVVGWLLLGSGSLQVERVSNHSRAMAAAWRCLSFGLGVLTNGVVLTAPWGADAVTNLFALGVALGLMVLVVRMGRRPIALTVESNRHIPCVVTNEAADGIQSLPATVNVTSATDDTCGEPVANPWPLLERVIAVVAACLVALAFVALSRLADQLTVSTLWAGAAKWASLWIGIALGAWLAVRWPLVARVGIVVIGVLACGVPLAVFGTLVEFSLELNTFVESPMAQVAWRCGLMLALFVPLGVWFGVQSRTNRWSQCPLVAAVMSGAFGAGYLLAVLVGLPSWGVSGLLFASAIGAFGLAIVGAARNFLFREADRTCEFDGAQGTAVSSSRWFAGVSLGAAVLLTAAVPLWAKHYQPEVAAKLLFDTRVFVAHRVEPRVDILQHLDGARFVSACETGSGTLTQWRFGGPRVQLRQSGVVTATHSLDGATNPQVISEALLATLPLVLHERPQHVAVLGLRSGLAIESALQFPVQSLTCAEPDAELSRVVQRDVWPQLVANPAQDERLTLLHAEPLLVLAAKPAAFDLIISNADQAVLAREAAAYTLEAYERAARALAPGGIFCQRFSVADVGREPVTLLLNTWQRAFHEVAVIETSSGEWLLVGSNAVQIDPNVLNDRPIVSEQPKSLCLRPGLIERLQRPHVRRALAAIGADWASPLLLSTLVLRQPVAEELLAASSVNSVRQASLTRRLPFDVLRWGNKLDEINAAYADQTRTLAARLGSEAETEEVTRRLTELALQLQIVRQHPDEYWAYRKAVKKRLTEAPYSKIIQVKGERPTKDLHPSEKRRLAYFETLGAAAKAKTPSASQLAAIAEFAEPHDPLISTFLHQEIAELASKRSADEVADGQVAAKRLIEWQQRLTCINFSDANDRSVRNVVVAIELLCQHPELIPREADRGDQLDALLQTLHARWFARGDLAPQSSQVMLSDLEHSIAAIDLACEHLDTLRAAREMRVADWDARRTALEKSLVRPLRQYRSLLAAHQAKERQPQ